MSTNTLPRKAVGPPKFARSSGIQRKAHKVVIYGIGGIGKTELASRAPKPLFIDLEGGSLDMDVQRQDGIHTWADLREFLTVGDFNDIETIVIDSGTKAEELCVEHVITTIRHEKQGVPITRLADYGYSKGTEHVYTEFVKLLGDLERHWRENRNIVMICHETIAKVPNPTGEDFTRYQPRLQSVANGNIAAKVKEWADHVFFISYDATIQKKKATGHGSRTIYCTETPSRVAKVRGLPCDPIVYNKGDRAIWDLIAGKSVEHVVEDAPELE